MTRDRQGIPNDIARLKGARFVATVESDEGRRLAEGLVKQMTGGEDLLTGRFLYGESFDFHPAFKLFLATNHKPEIRGTDEGIWDRIKLIPFTVRIPPDERDTHLSHKLRAELPGILAWAVRGCLEWQREGLCSPSEVNQATSEYRQDMDVLNDFISESCVVAPNCQAAATPLYDLYKTWSTMAGKTPISQRKFGERLGEKGFTSNREGSGRKLWRGIGIRASTE